MVTRLNFADQTFCVGRAVGRVVGLVPSWLVNTVPSKLGTIADVL